jgi:hypothetical protein
MQRNLANLVDRSRVRMNAKATSVLPDLCNFYFLSTDETRDSRGEVTTPDADPLEDVSCKILNLSPYERLAGGEVGASANAKLQVPVNAQTALIDGTYRGTIQARGVVGEKEFTVTGPPLPASDDCWLYLAIIVKG